MMGHQPDSQGKLFYPSLNLDKRIRPDHILRKIKSTIDFNFIYNEVKDKYGNKGNVSIPPPVILKLMLLLILYNVRSERELMQTLPERLDWLWFLDYDLDDELPHHSVISKARRRWGVKTFKHFFDRIVRQCIKSNLVDGSKLFMDSSYIGANASKNSVVKTEDLERNYRLLEDRLDDKDNPPEGGGTVNTHYSSKTDPDASIIRRGKIQSDLMYQAHRSVDEQDEIITSTIVSPGAENEAHYLSDLVENHTMITGKSPHTVVADSKYGTIENYLYCYDHKINAHITPLERIFKDNRMRSKIFPREYFHYNRQKDEYICPAGEILKRRHYYKRRQHYEYKAHKHVCSNCKLQSQCTRSPVGRTIKRHIRQDELDIMYFLAMQERSISDIKMRQHLMERSYAKSERYGYKRARWRRLWRVQIQEYLTASILNIKALIKHRNKPVLSLKNRLNDQKNLILNRFFMFLKKKMVLLVIL